MLNSDTAALAISGPFERDLGPVAWVEAELRRSLEAAIKSLRRFLREAEQSGHSDLESLDAAALRGARQHLHQVAGAFSMVGLDAAGVIVRAMETVVQKLVMRPSLCAEETVASLERAMFALGEYLDASLAGKPVAAVGLFPQYRDIQSLAGEDRAHPADLWAPARSAFALDLADDSAPLEYGPAARQHFDQAVLRVVKEGDRSAARQLVQLSRRFAAALERGEQRDFWLVCAGFFEAQSLGLLPPDLYAKRAASRVLVQYSEFARGTISANPRLLQDLLFFCAYAAIPSGVSAPALKDVQDAWDLERSPAPNYEQRRYGRFDPAVLAQARKRIGAAAETWSALAAGDRQKFKLAADQFSLVAESLRRLHPQSTPLADALTHVLDVTVQSGEIPVTALAMEVATSILYLQAAYEELDTPDDTMSDRAAVLAARLSRAGGAEAPERLERWMEDLYRRVSDRQTMGSVVEELRSTLREVELALDQYFRDSSDAALLVAVPGHLLQMRGVLSVLGLDQASHAVVRMRESADLLLAGSVADGDMRATLFSSLAANLGALGFLIDMLGYQPTLARKLFVFDEAQGELRVIMGRAESPSVILPAHAHPALANGAGLVQSSADRSPVSVESPIPDDSEPPGKYSSELGSLAEAESNSLAENVVPAEPATNADFVVNDPPLSVAADSRPVALPALTPSTSLAVDEDDAELREIFLEEAREVVANGHMSLRALAADSSDLSEQTSLRRAFHTLKGSSRMVKLFVLGDAAWAMEQLFNAWLAEQKALPESHRLLAADAMNAFGRWVDDIAQERDGHWVAEPFQASADALRLGEPPIALSQTGSGFLDTILGDDDFPAGTDFLPTAAHTSYDQPEIAATHADLAEDSLISLSFGAAPVLAPGETKNEAASPAAADPISSDIVEETSYQIESFDSVMPIPELDFSEFASLADERSGEIGDAQPASEITPESLTFAANDLANDGVVLDLPQEEVLAFEPELSDIDVAGLNDTTVLEFSVGASSVKESDTDLSAVASDVESDQNADDMKVIGSLRIPIPLYNVYLNEADEWSRRLLTELQEWSLELHREVPEPAISFAHSLAGSSATVGFHDLSRLARLLEHALSHVQLDGTVTVHQSGIFVDVAEDIRHLLHQFAAGFLREPTPRLLRAMQAIIDSEPAPVPSVASFLRNPDERPAEAIATQAGNYQRSPENLALVPVHEAPEPIHVGSDNALDFTAEHSRSGTDTGLVIASAREDQAPVANDTSVEAVAGVQAGDTPVARVVVDATAPESTGERTAQGNRALFGDEIDTVDVLDSDLFPIFDEEALELLPALNSSLRQWANEPDDLSARGEALRALHTLKGSARLAGALRLGELAHRFETEIEELGRDHLQASTIEPLLGYADTLRATLDQLRARDEAIQTVLAGSFEGASLSIDPVVHAADEVETVIPAAPVALAAMAPAAAFEEEKAAVPIAARNKVTVPVRAPIAASARAGAGVSVRVRSQLLDRLVNQASEVMISRSRLEAKLGQMQASLADLTGNLDRLRRHLRDIEVQSESQMQSRLALAKDTAAAFDPLEFDRFTRVQELTRMMAESVDDVATVQRNLQRSMQGSEDDLVEQGRQARELQRDLLRTRMVEFESIADRLYAVARQAAKETGKPITLDITGGAIEMDRGVLERLAPAFEHLLRNAVAHGIEDAAGRSSAGKPAAGSIIIGLEQAGNDVAVEFRDDGAGLDFDRIREKARALGLSAADSGDDDPRLAELIFEPGFSTASEVTELAGRGIGMDVVRSEVQAAGGRIETESKAGGGTRFRLILPLTTAVTQVVMLRAGGLVIGVPATVVELVRRATSMELEQAYASGTYSHDTQDVPFYWAGALLQASARSHEPATRTRPVIVLRSARQRIAVHVDEVLGQQEVVVKNLGPQLARLPGLSGMSVLPSGAVILIYNPVALANVFGERLRGLAPLTRTGAQSGAPEGEHAQGGAQLDIGGIAGSMGPAADIDVPLVMVVDDSITVRRVTQRLLRREGYRVVLASDGLQALERLQVERPVLVLSDIEMPRMDGFDLVRNIRADTKLHGLPIVMITSRIAAKHREHAMALGANHYLGKPYPEEELLGLVRRYALTKSAPDASAITSAE